MFKALLLVLALSHATARHRTKAERPEPTAHPTTEAPIVAEVVSVPLSEPVQPDGEKH